MQEYQDLFETAPPKKRTSGLFGAAAVFLIGIVGGTFLLQEENLAALRALGGVATSVAADIVSPATVDAESTEAPSDREAEILALKRRIEELEHGQPSRPAGNAMSANTPSSASRRHLEAGERTLSFWNGLNEVLAREAAMRAAPTKLTSGNAGSFLTARIKASDYAVRGIRRLDRGGVDPGVLRLADELMAWYQEGVTINQQASQLFTRADVATRKGAPGKSWQQAESHHRQHVVKINGRAKGLRSQMKQKYGLAFPPLH